MQTISITCSAISRRLIPSWVIIALGLAARNFSSNILKITLRGLECGYQRFRPLHRQALVTYHRIIHKSIWRSAANAPPLLRISYIKTTGAEVCLEFSFTATSKSLHKPVRINHNRYYNVRDFFPRLAPHLSWRLLVTA